ncbi:MAG: caspase family protein [Pseudonocardiales bacterium]|nr:caspase family protein [Pseudonocardiales bacterium]
MEGRRQALIVANDDYEHDGLRRLLSPVADAQALARVLGDPQIGDFDVRVVHNEPAHAIQAQIEDLFVDSRTDDVLVLHFSCHGLKSESGELFFAARNTRPNRLGSTAVPADFVQRCMRSSRSRAIVLFLDCCYGGAFGQGVTVRASGGVNVLDSFSGEKLGGGRGRAVITASNSMEYAFEGDQLADDRRQPSVFSAALVEGLATGDADRDEDGWVSLNELYDYVFDKVREQNPHQTPSRDVQLQGELYLARSRRRRIHALPIPADLRAAMTDPNMITRLGAVSELRSRLMGEDLPAAAGARDALVEMTRTNIGYVAEPAAAALREAAVHTAEIELHFGQLVQGSRPAHQTVHPLGPPLARVCTFHASHRWIHITETTDGFEVSIDTAQAGTLRGEITLKGLTGETVIPIDATVITPDPELSITQPSTQKNNLWKGGAICVASGCVILVVGYLIPISILITLGIILFVSGFLMVIIASPPGP